MILNVILVLYNWIEWMALTFMIYIFIISILGFVVFSIQISKKEEIINNTKKGIRFQLILSELVLGAGIEQNEYDGSIKRIIAFVKDDFIITPKMPKSINTYPISYLKINKENLELVNHLAINGKNLAKFDLFNWN